MTGKIEPKSHREHVALFRMQVLGPMLNRELRHGELAACIREAAKKRYKPPGAAASRHYGASTIERWYFAWKRDGLEGLQPGLRKRGSALALTEDQRQLLLEIRREYPRMPATVIVDTLEGDGRIERGQVSIGAIRRLLRDHASSRCTSRTPMDAQEHRRRWEAEFVGELWHGDVCHGPSLTIRGRSVPIRVHAVLDDKSRFVPALCVTSDEEEVRMLELMLEATRMYGAPRRLYLDNGSTYRGRALETACARLGIVLTHARPYDPEARGKMERFWRTMREGCLDYVGNCGSIHDVQVRLTAWLNTRYHVRPHASLVGRTPAKLWSERRLEEVDEPRLQMALTVRETRKVRHDCTLSVGGLDWELKEAYLAGRNVTVGRTLAVPQAAPWVEHEEARYELHIVDPVANGKLRRRRRARKPGIDAIDFDPAKTLLDRMLHRKSDRTTKGDDE